MPPPPPPLPQYYAPSRLEVAPDPLLEPGRGGVLLADHVQRLQRPWEGLLVLVKACRRRLDWSVGRSGGWCGWLAAELDQQHAAPQGGGGGRGGLGSGWGVRAKRGSFRASAAAQPPPKPQPTDQSGAVHAWLASLRAITTFRSAIRMVRLVPVSEEEQFTFEKQRAAQWVAEKWADVDMEED